MASSEDRRRRRTRGRLRAAAKPRPGEGLSTRSWDARPPHLAEQVVPDVTLECGWGRVLFGQTFATHAQLVAAIAKEEPGRRDICLYVREPHVLVSMAPQELFIDPSHTYRLWLAQHRAVHEPIRGIVVRELQGAEDAEAVNRIYTAAGMVTAPSQVLWDNQRTATFTYLVAEDAASGEVVGTVTGIDHRHAFNDPEDGTSLWCLAVDPQNTRPGVGAALVHTLAARFQARGRAYLDLSVMYDNEPAIALYEKLGFVRVPVFCVKRKNPINERLFSASPAEGLDDLNPYARIVADEALRRGIGVDVVDADAGFLRLTHGGREVHTRESLSELTSAVALSRCDDKRVTRRLLAEASIPVARGRAVTDDEADERFLEEVGEAVVKPARGEQGMGVTVGLRTVDELREAVDIARRSCPDVLVEEHVHGDDLRVLVIDHEVVAAAVRRPATVVGTGRHSIRDLIEATSRRRQAATGGESRIPVDLVTERTVAAAGWDIADVLPEGEALQVRGTANLHTGGTIHDVTADIHPLPGETAVRVSEALDIPVVGVDLIVPDLSAPEHVVVEANERPGLANHEPQPTAARFIDLLFPGTRALPRGWSPGAPQGQDHLPGTAAVGTAEAPGAG